jgi:hypothetical protein
MQYLLTAIKVLLRPHSIKRNVINMYGAVGAPLTSALNGGGGVVKIHSSATIRMRALCTHHDGPQSRSRRHRGRHVILEYRRDRQYWPATRHVTLSCRQQHVYGVKVTAWNDRKSSVKCTGTSGTTGTSGSTSTSVGTEQLWHYRYLRRDRAIVELQVPQ